jgi:hypothetical protein
MSMTIVQARLGLSAKKQAQLVDLADCAAAARDNHAQVLETRPDGAAAGARLVRSVTHDYVGYGITSLFTTLNVLDGSVATPPKPQHGGLDFFAFLRISRPMSSAASAIELIVLAQASEGQRLALATLFFSRDR